MQISVPVSIGELFDKITILRIKNLKIKDLDKLENVKKELLILESLLKDNNLDKNSKYQIFMYSLHEINNSLWNIEDRIRDFDSKSQFDELFVETAKLVYEFNDARAKIKKDINLHYGSDIVEEKSYAR